MSGEHAACTHKKVIASHLLHPLAGAVPRALCERMYVRTDAQLV